MASINLFVPVVVIKSRHLPYGFVLVLNFTTKSYFKNNCTFSSSFTISCISGHKFYQNQNIWAKTSYINLQLNIN